MYTVTVDIKRVVAEKYECKISASNLGEALDVAYEHFSTFPDSNLELTTRRKVFEKTLETEILYIDHDHAGPDGYANDGNEIA